MRGRDEIQRRTGTGSIWIRPSDGEHYRATSGDGSMIALTNCRLTLCVVSTYTLLTKWDNFYCTPPMMPVGLVTVTIAPDDTWVGELLNSLTNNSLVAVARPLNAFKWVRYEIPA